MNERTHHMADTLDFVYRCGSRYIGTDKYLVCRRCIGGTVSSCIKSPDLVTGGIVFGDCVAAFDFYKTCRSKIF